MLEHLRELLAAAVAQAGQFSTQISTLLTAGKGLDDPEVAPIVEQRAKAYEDIATYQSQLTQEMALADVDTEAATALETYQRAGQAWNQPVGKATSGGGSEEGEGASSDAPVPFETFGAQMAAVAIHAMRPEAPVDPRLEEIQQFALGLGEDIPSAGGFLVQTDFSAELLRKAHETGKLINMPRHIPISGTANGLKINAVDESSRVNGSRLGGVQTFWTAEAGSFTKSKPTFRQIELSLHKLTGLYYATDEELSDTAALEATLSGFFAEEFGFKLDDALIRGVGAGEPLGILGHAGSVSVTKETGQAANTILTENIEKMYSRMWARSIQNATWLINQDTWPQLFALQKAVGTGGVPVFLPAAGLSAAPFGMLLGRPILPIEQCETLGTKGDIILADFSSGYIMIDKGGIDAAVSIHVQFLTDESVFRFILRTDGQPIANTPLTPYKGTNTQSSFITLNSRS